MSIKSIVIKKALEYLMGVDKRTQTDLYNQLASLVTNLGTQSYDAAGWLLARIKSAYTQHRDVTQNLSLSAGTSMYVLDYSGDSAYYLHTWHRSVGILASRSNHRIYFQVPASWHLARMCDVFIIDNYGLGAVGEKVALKAFVKVWDTTNNIYEVIFFEHTINYCNRRLIEWINNGDGVDATITCSLPYYTPSASTHLEFIRARDFESIELRQRLIDLGYECGVGLQYAYDEQLAVNRPLLRIVFQKYLNAEQVDEIVKFVYDNEYAVEIVRIENVLASPRKLIYKVTPIEEVQKAIAKVARVGREIPVLPRLRAGRIEETVALIPDWLNRLRPDLVGRVHSPQEINEILTTKPYEVLP